MASRGGEPDNGLRVARKTQIFKDISRALMRLRGEGPESLLSSSRDSYLLPTLSSPAVDYAERALLVSYAVENVLVDANGKPAGTDVSHSKKR
jgi:hypothetical protein